MAAILYERRDIAEKPNSRLRQVIVYQGRAQAFRVMTTALKPGPQTVVFTALGREIEEDNIKAVVTGAPARLVSVSLEKKSLYFFNKKENEKVSRETVAALKKLIELCDRRTVLAVEAGLIAELRGYLERALSGILLEQDTAITRLKEALDFLRGLLDRNRDDAVAGAVELERAEENYRRLCAVLDRIRRWDKRETHDIRLEIESGATAEQEAEVEISYTLRGAQWRTSYDAALTTAEKKLVLSVYGEITQASGEDWEEATVILSSAETETGITIPDIHPLSLSGYEEKTSPDVVTAEEDIEDLTTGAGQEAAPPPRTETPAAKKGTAYAFTLPRPVMIPADGLEHRFLIRRDDCRPVLSYETVPAVMEYVYLKAVFPNASGAPLLPGRVMIYRNGSYIGRTETPYTADGEECALSFGIDLDLKVKRIVLKDQYTPPKGLAQRQRREYSFRYILSHFKEQAVRVVLKEAIHLSEVEKIKVRIEDDTSPGFAHDREGVVSFERELKPGKFERTQLLLHYTIEAPKAVSLENV